jgi:OPA family sugar phosphate sensor protein UhpC-like MFS transporter
MTITRYAINSWGVLYLQESRGYTLVQAGSILGLNTVAGIAGCVAYGLVSDRLFAGRRPPVNLLFGVIEIVALGVIFLAPPGHTVLLTVAFTVYGFTLSGLLAALGGLFAIDIVSKRAAGAAMGILGAFGYLAAGAQERISGLLIQRGMTIEGGERSYDFTDAAWFWVGASVVSLVLSTLLWRVRARD